MYPRPAAEKPAQLNYAARHKFVGAAMTGFFAVGMAMIYVFDMVSIHLRIGNIMWSPFAFMGFNFCRATDIELGRKLRLLIYEQFRSFS